MTTVLAESQEGTMGIEGVVAIKPPKQKEARELGEQDELNF